MGTAPSSTIAVRVLLFASYAERMGLDSLDVRLPAPATVGSVLERVRSLPGGRDLPLRPLCALNLAHASLDQAVSAGDELAVLPPMAGG
jgi:molybdopterin converting factor small subunit